MNEQHVVWTKAQVSGNWWIRKASRQTHLFEWAWWASCPVLFLTCAGYLAGSDYQFTIELAFSLWRFFVVDYRNRSWLLSQGTRKLIVEVDLAERRLYFQIRRCVWLSCFWAGWSWSSMGRQLTNRNSGLIRPPTLDLARCRDACMMDRMRGPYGTGTAPCNGCTENNRGPVLLRQTPSFPCYSSAAEALFSSQKFLRFPVTSNLWSYAWSIKYRQK
jgi:hypothetical protein